MKIENNCVINGMPETIYHADPCPTPSFSSSMARDLVEKTPLQAMLRSRRLNSNYRERKSDAMNFGTLAHDFILKGGRSTFEIAPFDSWRTKDSQAVRNSIQARGLIALNESTAEECVGQLEKMRSALKDQIAKHAEYPKLMISGKAEQSAFFFDGDLWNRARFDWLDDAYPDTPFDYKTTGLTFEQWQRQELWGGGYMQAAHYQKVFAGVFSKPSGPFTFIVQQTFEPFMMMVFTIDRSFDEQVMERYNLARLKFKTGVAGGGWPGASNSTQHSCPPPWVLGKWEMDNLDSVAETVEQPEPTDDIDYALAG